MLKIRAKCESKLEFCVLGCHHFRQGSNTCVFKRLQFTDMQYGVYHECSVMGVTFPNRVEVRPITYFKNK